jgi:hypothetical protein
MPVRSAASFTSEPLEARTLLAGVTIITHGFDGTVTGWVAKMADDIAVRAGGSSDVSLYTMTVGRDSKRRLAVLSLVRDRGSSGYQATGSGEVIVKLDWSTVSGGAFSTGDVADVVGKWLLAQRADDASPRFVELPIHLIGHSRGASLICALSQDLGRAGIWVDQQTNLDPHPVDGTADFGANFGDAPMKTFDNVAFSDTYWRSDGNVNNFDPDGQSVGGSHDVSLNDSVQQQHAGLAHQSVTSYYDGTIDTKATEGGDNPIFNSWYGTGPDKPSRTQTGFVFSSLVGGARPADGLWSASGGTAPRESAGQDASQWPDVADLRLLGARTIAPGKTIKIRFVRGDRDSNAKLTLLLDRDTNPYDDNFVRTLRRTNLGSSSAPIANRSTGSTAGAETGTYWVCARITDSRGHTRYSYSKSFQIVAPSAHAISPLLAQRRLPQDIDQRVQWISHRPETARRYRLAGPTVVAKIIAAVGKVWEIPLNPSTAVIRFSKNRFHK